MLLGKPTTVPPPPPPLGGELATAVAEPAPPEEEDPLLSTVGAAKPPTTTPRRGLDVTGTTKPGEDVDVLDVVVAVLSGESVGCWLCVLLFVGAGLSAEGSAEG